MRALQFKKRSLLLHPLVVFSGIWFAMVFLYSLHLSDLLLFSTSEVMRVACYIYLPFVGGIALYSAFHYLASSPSTRSSKPASKALPLLERRLSFWFGVWLVITIAEIAVSGGLPIIWLVRHSDKTYVDFGIPSLHGLVNSLLVSIAVCHVALYLVTRLKRHLIIPIFVILWSAIVVTRQLMLTSLLEYAVVFLSLRVVRVKTIVRAAFIVLLFIFIFGLLGDFRSGAENFRKLAQPTAQYPDWLPSGVLWVYIYVTTPINNLLYTMQSSHPLASLLFPNTAATLFPSFIRTLIYGSQVGQAESGNLVTQAFNVSTAYVGPYQDYGKLGIILLSLLMALVCQAYWYRSALKDILIFAVLTQCLAFTVFFNLFFALPVISQVVWLTYFFLPRIHFGWMTRSAPTFG